MKKSFSPFLIILAIFFLPLTTKSSSNNNLIQILSEGDNVIFIRHALAPGGGDPSGFKIHDCNTQRNLNSVGIKQSKNIGKFFKIKKVPIDAVLSSQWCRCKDTAKYAFKNFEEFSALNSTFQSSFAKNQPKQLRELKTYVKNWKTNGGNLVLVTHFSIITAITTAVPSSGEIIVTDKNFNVLGSILID